MPTLPPASSRDAANEPHPTPHRTPHRAPRPEPQREPHPEPHREPHRERGVAESFGVDPERYDRTRPPYPDALIDAVVAAAPGPDLLDVGTGTGIAARQFRAAGCRVSGVEPDARMAELARRDGTDVDVATFETWEPGGRTFDVVVAGQAWHWVDPVAGAVRAGQVLRPGGLLAVFWHVVQLPPEVTEAFASACQRALPDSPFDLRGTGSALAGYQVMFDRAAEGVRGAGGFGEPAQWRFDWERTYTRDAWLDQLPTQGTLTRVPEQARAAILEAVGAAVDALGGSFTASYATVAVTAVRTGGS